MTDEDAQQIAERPDWWMGPDGQGEAMRSLREALVAKANYPGRAFLFRPGGAGAPAVWLSAEDIARLHALLNVNRERAA